MRIFLLLFFTSLAFFAIGCGDSVEKAKNQVCQTVATATNVLASYKAEDLPDFLPLRTQFEAMKTSLASNDFSKARACADEIDKLLKTKVVAQSIEFIRIGATDNGANKAKAAIAEYMAKNNLDVTETEVYQELLRHFEGMDKRQCVELATVVIYIALEKKMSHGAARPAALAHVWMDELLGSRRTSNSPPATTQLK